MDVETQRRSILGCELVADVARTFGQVRLKVTGASMIPAIWPGDVITVWRCKFAEMEPGQIVLYRREGKLVVHRITSIQGDWMITRGDSLEHDDPPIDRSAIVGRVVRVVRNGCEMRPARLSRFASTILRRSDFCKRMALLVGRRITWLVSGEISWAR